MKLSWRVRGAGKKTSATMDSNDEEMPTDDSDNEASDFFESQAFRWITSRTLDITSELVDDLYSGAASKMIFQRQLVFQITNYQRLQNKKIVQQH